MPILIYSPCAKLRAESCGRTVREHREVFREGAALAIHAATAMPALAVGALLAATGRYFAAAVLLALGAVDARFCFARAVLKGRVLVLHELTRTRSIPVDDIAWIDPELKGAWMRTPRMSLRSGGTIRLGSFRVPSLVRTASRAARDLAEGLDVPLPIVAKTAPGWFSDPYGAGLRWWNGNDWTRITLTDVADEEEAALAGSERGSQDQPSEPGPGTRRSA